MRRAAGALILLLSLMAAVGSRQSAIAGIFPTADCRLPTAAIRLVQAKNPFAIAGREGGAPASGLGATLLAWQEKFNRELQQAAKALKAGDGAFWTLAAASFAYGVFHAAGPGHGKAVLASYMIASRIALRRGVILAALAALLQGGVAIALVGLAAALLGATATTMKAVAERIEVASYAAIALVGLSLVWKKGDALFSTLRASCAPGPSRSGLYCEAVDAGAAQCGPDCGHQHAIDPTRLQRGVFSSEALGAVVAAGLRPCSGAILILVFTLAQGVFWAGIAATLCMAAGTALTTAALAAVAVFARRRAEAWSAAGRAWTGVALRGAEFAAAALVLLLGVVLLAGWSSGA
ncbi:MAG TPA: high frequency lysogenization protein HflD [Methylocystis sp.]|nr:high frequency lysogenization protein HflD [Methylocystis sp.]